MLINHKLIKSKIDKKIQQVIVKEQWQASYKSHAGIYDEFSMFEDEDNKILNLLNKYCQFDGSTLLDVGCGSGKYAQLLAPRCKLYYALEPSPALLELTKLKCADMCNVKFINSGAENIPLADESVDIVLATWVLGGMTRGIIKKSADKELSRVLKPEGSIWAVENFCSSDFMEMRGITIEDTDNWQHPLTHFGFKCVEIVDTNFAFQNLNQAKRVLRGIFGDRVDVYFSDKFKPKLGHRVIIMHRAKKTDICPLICS